MTCIAGVHQAVELPARWEVASVTGLLVAFPLVAWVTGIVPREHVAQISSIIRSLLTRSEVGRKDAVSRLKNLGLVERSELELLIRNRASPSMIADVVGRPESAILDRFVTTLRVLGGVKSPSHNDTAIGAHLLSPGPTAEKDSSAQRLWQDGVDPLDLHSLEATSDRLGRLPARVWGTPGKQRNTRTGL
jgi:hypothetical protein